MSSSNHSELSDPYNKMLFEGIQQQAVDILQKYSETKEVKEDKLLIQENESLQENQKKILDQLQKNISSKIDNRLDIAKSNLALAVAAEIKKLQFDPDKSYESQIKAIEDILTSAKTYNQEIEKKQGKEYYFGMESKFSTFIDEIKNSLSKTALFQVYEVRVKTEWPDKKLNLSNLVQYKGKARVAAETLTAPLTFVGGTVKTGVGIGVFILGGISSIKLSDLLPRELGGGSIFSSGSSLFPGASQKIMDKGADLTISGFDTAVQGAKDLAKPFESSAYSIVEDIPADKIKSIVAGPMKDTVNPNYETKYDDEYNYVSLFIVEGQNPNKLFQMGTNHMLGNSRKTHNPHGHVFIFKNEDDALNFIKLRQGGNKYDPIAGWRVNNDWKDSQLSEVKTNFNNRANNAEGPSQSININRR